MSELSLSVAGLLSQHLPSEVRLTGRKRGPGVNPAPQLAGKPARLHKTAKQIMAFASQAERRSVPNSGMQSSWACLASKSGPSSLARLLDCQQRGSILYPCATCYHWVG